MESEEVAPKEAYVIELRPRSWPLLAVAWRYDVANQRYDREPCAWGTTLPEVRRAIPAHTRYRHPVRSENGMPTAQVEVWW